MSVLAIGLPAGSYHHIRMKDINELTRLVIGEALHIHTGLGPGLMESVYQRVFHRRLLKRDLFVEAKKRVTFVYDGEFFEGGLEIDLLVDRRLIVELKSCKAFDDVHFKQLLTYLRLTNCKLGLLINFGAASMNGQIKRVVNGQLHEV